jgi:hypothetical protein
MCLTHCAGPLLREDLATGGARELERQAKSPLVAPSIPVAGGQPHQTCSNQTVEQHRELWRDISAGQLACSSDLLIAFPVLSVISAPSLLLLRARRSLLRMATAGIPKSVHVQSVVTENAAMDSHSPGDPLVFPLRPGYGCPIFLVRAGQSQLIEFLCGSHCLRSASRMPAKEF